jgi:hypothetical protein
MVLATLLGLLAAAIRVAVRRRGGAGAAPPGRLWWLVGGLAVAVAAVTVGVTAFLLPD